MTTHIFYDTETTGANPQFDQILQAAAIQTDDDFVELDSVDIRSRLAPHMVPAAGALKVTHVDPYEIARAPFSAHDFTRRLHDLFSRWSDRGETAFGGYNTIRFDEEILRQAFWQNLLDPYITSGRDRSRMDYLIMTRALHARNPDVIDFPINEETGKKNFRLENIAPLNGFSDHDAHDALGDVRATIHMARLIRDIDPALFSHMEAMGNANTARDFIDQEVVFQLVAGPMVNPGVLDVCLITSEAVNNKNKLAWNLAIDPLPFLDLSAEEIFERMRKTGTPFKTVKANKQPGVFPMSWGFMNRVSNENFAPADPDEIDARTEMIRSHQGFQAEAARALMLRSDSYDAPEHLEEKIYSGFPSWADNDRMKAFHNAPDWTRRLEISRSFEKKELRAIGMRLVFFNAPEVLSTGLRNQIDERIASERFTLDTERPWNTVGKLMSELDEMQAAAPDDPELSNIRKWALETYRAASDWTGKPEAEPKGSDDSSQTASGKEALPKAKTAPKAKTGPKVKTGPKAKAGPKEKTNPAGILPGQVEDASMSYLDGLA